MLLVINGSRCICLMIVLCLCSCGSTAREEADDAAAVKERRAAARLAPGWLNPMTIQIHGAADKPEEGELVLKGRLDGWLFTPAGEISGTLREAPKTATLKSCRLVVTNRSLCFEGDTLPVGSHYLTGMYDTETKLFYPSSRGFQLAGN